MNQSMKARVLTSVMTSAFVLTGTMGTAWAGPCDGMDSQLKKISKQLKTVCDNKDKLQKLGITDPGFCDNPQVADAAKFAKEVVSAWNSIVGNSAAKIGARQFKLGKGGNGTIVGSTQRMWVSDSIATSNSLTVKVNEQAGQAKMNVNVCVVDLKGGKPKLKKQVVFNGSKKEKKNTSESKTIKVKGVKGKIVMVKISAARATTNKFKYKFTAK